MAVNPDDELKERRFHSIVLRILLGMVIPALSIFMIFLVGIITDGSPVIILPIMVGVVCSILATLGVSSACKDIDKYMT